MKFLRIRNKERGSGYVKGDIIIGKYTGEVFMVTKPESGSSAVDMEVARLTGHTAGDAHGEQDPSCYRPATKAVIDVE